VGKGICHTCVNDASNKHAGNDQALAHLGFYKLFDLLLECTRTIINDASYKSVTNNQ
jgi:hypothetical protein